MMRCCSDYAWWHGHLYGVDAGRIVGDDGAALVPCKYLVERVADAGPELVGIAGGVPMSFAGSGPWSLALAAATRARPDRFLAACDVAVAGGVAVITYANRLLCCAVSSDGRVETILVDPGIRDGNAHEPLDYRLTRLVEAVSSSQVVHVRCEERRIDVIRRSSGGWHTTTIDCLPSQGRPAAACRTGDGTVLVFDSVSPMVVRVDALEACISGVADLPGGPVVACGFDADRGLLHLCVPGKPSTYLAHPLRDLIWR